mgnify:FL=1
MDTLQQLPTHGDGPLDMRELSRTLLETMAREVMDAQADMLCGDGRTSETATAGAASPPPWATSRSAYPSRGPAPTFPRA